MNHPRSLRQNAAKLVNPFTSRQISFNTSKENHHLFNYTSGRWLWNEKRQLLDRFRSFNIHELKRVACSVVDATECVPIEKIGEGGFNKVFRLVMQTARRSSQKFHIQMLARHVTPRRQKWLPWTFAELC
jgi:hypothetical protein